MTISNPTLNRVCLAGIGGGLLLIAALYYPLYVLLPGNYLADWQQGSALLGIILQAAAALVAVGIGYTTARWVKTSTRRDAMIFGALAGAIASVIAYAGLVGAAAGVVGSAVLVQHGVTPAVNNEDMLQLLYQVVVGTMWWTYGSFWGLLLAGIGLSALGGLLATQSDTPTEWKAVRFLAVGPLKVAVFFSASVFFLAYALYQLLEPATQRGVDQNGLTIPWQYVNGITLLPMGTALAVSVAALAALYYILRAERQGDYARFLFRQPVGLALGCGVLALGVFLVAVNALPAEFNSNTKVVLIGGGLMGLILTAGLMNMALEERRRMVVEGLMPPLTRWQMTAFGGYVVGMVLLFVPSLPLIGLAILGASVIIADRESRKAALDIRQLANDVREAVRARHFVPSLSVWGWFVLAVGLLLVVGFVLSGLVIEGIILAVAIIFYTYGADKAFPKARPVSLQSPLPALLPTITAMSLVALVGVPTILTMVQIIVPTIPSLASYDQPLPPDSIQPTMTGLLQDSYLTHLEILLLVFIGATVLVGLGMLVRWGVLRWSMRRAVQIEAAV